MNLNGIRHEDQLLLCFARTAIDEETASRIHSLIGQNIDWRYLLERATHHRVIPLLYRGLLRSRTGLVPDRVMAELAHQSAVIAARNLLLTAELIKLSEWLDSQQIRAIPYKGPTSAVVAYGNVGLRQFGDLDILVQPRDYLKTRDLFLLHGFRVTSDWGWECSLMDDSRHVPVDVHKGLGPAQFPVELDFEGLWDRRQPVSIAGGRISTFCVEDMLLVLCIQLVKDGWGESTLRLSKVCDIAELVRARPEIDWARVLDETGRIGCRRMLWLSLAVAHELLGAPIQSVPSPPRDLRLGALAGHILHRIFEDDERPSHGQLSRAAFHFQVRERWRDKLYPWYHAFKLRLIPNELDHAVLKLPPSLSFLYYLIRPLRVTRDHSRTALGLLKAKWTTWSR